MERQKRIAAVHDISGFGRCSLTVALPIISAAGIECSAVPTAVLSTHTGGFAGFTYRDLTEDLPAFISHWQSLRLTFDGIYSGFLGSAQQIDIVGHMIDTFKGPQTLVMVDPVMADNGRLYSIFSQDFALQMKGLCAKADIIVPNITEAVMLLGEEYREGPYEPAYIEGLLRRLSAMGPSQVVLTGIWFDDRRLGAACYDRHDDEMKTAFSPKVEGMYHGTGDVFASALMAALTLGRPLHQAVELAVNFTYSCIERTCQAGTDRRFGVNFEASLPGLIRSLGLM